MTRRRDVRIGSGEFHDPAGPTLAALELFFEAVRQVVPDVFDELEALRIIVPHDPGKIWPFMLRDGDYERIADPALTAWSIRRGLTAPPCMTVVKASLLGWATGNIPRRTWALGLVTHEPEAVPLPHPVWNPRWETAAAFRARVDAYITEVSDAERTRGAKPTPVKREHPGAPVRRHFEWLALHVVGGLTLDAIAERYQTVDGLTTQAVSAGIHSAAGLAAISIRSS